MKIFPISCESLGTRSFAHLVMTRSVNILIDPSVSLGPTRFGLRPLPIEIAASWISRKIILEFAELVDVIIQSHYHGDHFTLGVERKYEFTNRDVFNSIYSPEVTILAKDPDKYLNYNQQKRAKYLWKNKKLKLSKADNSTYEIGSTKIVFSPPVPHGSEGARGYVLETMIEEDDFRYIYTSDVCGPSSNIATEFIEENTPDLVALDGFPFYLSKTKDEFAKSFEYLGRVIDSAKEVYIDHHFLRSLKWEEILKENLGKELRTFSMMRNQEPILLEAQRKIFFDKSPIKEEFYTAFENDKISITFYKELLNRNGYYQYWKKLSSDVNIEIEKKRK